MGAAFVAYVSWRRRQRPGKCGPQSAVSEDPCKLADLGKQEETSQVIIPESPKKQTGATCQSFDVPKKDQASEVQGDQFCEMCQDVWEQVAGRGQSLKTGGVVVIMRNLKLKVCFPNLPEIETSNDKETASLMKAFLKNSDGEIKKTQFPEFMKLVLSRS